MAVGPPRRIGRQRGSVAPAKRGRPRGLNGVKPGQPMDRVAESVLPHFPIATAMEQHLDSALAPPSGQFLFTQRSQHSVGKASGRQARIRVHSCVRIVGPSWIVRRDDRLRGSAHARLRPPTCRINPSVGRLRHSRRRTEAGRGRLPGAMRVEAGSAAEATTWAGATASAAATLRALASLANAAAGRSGRRSTGQ